MNKQLNFLKRTFAIGIIAVSVIISSCQKTEEVKVVKEDPKMEALIKYMTVCFGVKSTDITYDKNTNEFIILRKYRHSKTEIEYLYDTANEYKAKYENN